MSFAKAMHEIADLEIRLKELERQGRGKDLELERVTAASARSGDPAEIESVIQALKDKTGEEAVKVLVQFGDNHQSLETGVDISRSFSAELHSLLVEAIAERLERKSDDENVEVECLRLARGLMRESRQSCSRLVNNAFDLFLKRIARNRPQAVRDGAIRAFQNAIVHNASIRDSLIQDEQAVDRLSLAMEEIAAMIRDPDESPNGECARVFVALKSLFDGSSGPQDKLVARMFIKTKMISSIIERMTKVFLEITDIGTKTIRVSNYPALSLTCEGISRGTLLIDGFRFLYVAAIVADEEMLQAMLQNDGVPTLAGEQLERCDLSDPNLGVGDRYVFLQTHVLLASMPMEAPKKDVDNLDQIKSSVCSILMFADKAPGFMAYLFRHGVSRALFDLLDRATTRAKQDHSREDDLLPILIAMKTLVDNNDDFKEQFQDMFFERLLPEIDPADYNTQEEYNQAREKRHYSGRSIPDTVFGKVVALLTSFEDHIKRYAGELLYYLCDDDPNKVTHLVGFGHAAHILAIKGGMIGQLAGSS